MPTSATNPAGLNPHFAASLQVDRQLTEGLDVQVRWTSAGSGYQALGTVSKINHKSVRVTLDHEVPAASGAAYPAGHAITVPRVLANPHAWTPSNGVFPRP